MQLAPTAPLRTRWRDWTNRSCATNRSSTLCRSKSLAAAGATPLPGAAPSSPFPANQPYGRLPSPPPPPKLTPDISLRDFRAWKATWEDYFELSNGPRLTDSHQLALLRTCLSPDLRATLGQTISSRDQLEEIAGYFRRQHNVALHRVKFEQCYQYHGETFDHFYVALRELAADADLCGTCLNDRFTTCIMPGVASEDLCVRSCSLSAPSPDWRTS